MTKLAKTQTWKRDNYTCQRCRKANLKGIDLTCDHIIPKSLGGTSDLTNLQTLCLECHRKKTWEEDAIHLRFCQHLEIVQKMMRINKPGAFKPRLQCQTCGATYKTEEAFRTKGGAVNPHITYLPGIQNIPAPVQKSPAHRSKRPSLPTPNPDVVAYLTDEKWYPAT